MCLVLVIVVSCHGLFVEGGLAFRLQIPGKSTCIQYETIDSVAVGIPRSSIDEGDNRLNKQLDASKAAPSVHCQYPTLPCLSHS